MVTMVITKSLRILTASKDRTCKLWDVENGECVQSFEGHEHWICSAASSPDGALVLTASLDNTAKLWSTESGECARTFEGHDDCVSTAVFANC